MAKKFPTGAPLWMVTFADLMSILVSFFVLIVSFSVPDIEKIKIAAGSLRDAFGIQRELILTGMVELDGSPIYEFAQDLSPWQIESIVGPIPDDGRDMRRIAAYQSDWEDLLEPTDVVEGSGATRSEHGQMDELEEELKNRIAAIPDLKGLEENLIIEKKPEGLRIQLVDQAEFSMFPLGSVQMYESTRQLLNEVAEVIGPLPNAIEVVGHTDGYAFTSGKRMDNWTLSLGRADETRRALLDAGLEPSRLDNIAGRADTDHLFPANPLDPRNRRISITLLRTDEELRAAEELEAEEQLSPPPAQQPRTRWRSIYSAE